MAKMRSPNYPALGLSQAIEAANALYRKEQQTPVPPDVAAKALGYASLSGPARTKIATLKQYNLLDETKQGVRISPLALRILRPADEGEKQEALKEAASTPSLFRELLEAQPGASDDALAAYLVRQRKFSEDGARNCIKAYRDALSLAGLTAEGYTPKENGGGGTQMSGSVAPPVTSSGARPGGSSTNEVLRVILAPDLSAEVRFSGARANQMDPLYLELLSEQLDFMRKQMERLQKRTADEEARNEEE
jgi:hypothetical protein